MELKKNLLCLAVLGTCLTASADLTPKAKVNGTTVEKGLKSITFDGDNVCLIYEDETTETVDMDDVVVAFEDAGQGGQGGDVPSEITGDINGDGEVDVTDVNLVIDTICGEPGAGNADINNDGEVDVTDLNLVIDIIIGE